MNTVATKTDERELTDPKRFALAVRSRLEAVGLTQAKLASLLGISQPSVASILSGRRMPEIETVLRLEIVLSMPRNSLFDSLRKI